ncbi:MAG: pseudouridine synthase [Bacteroidia bacterium]
MKKRTSTGRAGARSGKTDRPGADRRGPRAKSGGDSRSERGSSARPKSSGWDDFDAESRPARRSRNEDEPRSRGARPTSDRPRRDDAGPRRDRPSSDRPARSGAGSRGGWDDKPRRSNDREERPTTRRSYGDRDEKPRRSSDRGEGFRSRESRGDREERPARRSYGDRDEKPRRSSDREEGFRSRESRGDREERPARRSYGDRDEKPRRSSDRGEGFRSRERSDDREERPTTRRSYGDRDEKPRRSGDREEGFRSRESRGDREERPARRTSDRPDRESRGDTGRGRRPSAEARHEHFEKKYAGRIGEKKSTRPRKASDGPDLSGEVRLNRFIAMAGLGSRREADDLITAGLIMVNGKLVTELGTKVRPGDDVRYNGERIRNEQHVYLLLNKPKDYITTVDDPNERKTVMELVAGACPERIYPVGRLDRNTTGLLLFTNDGDLARYLTHPSSRVKKIYSVELDKNLKVADFRQLMEGVELEDGITRVDDIAYDGDGSNKKIVGVELHSGKNRVVRRLFEALGYEVLKLDRVGFAGLTKKDLPRGRWRFLEEKEIGYLKMTGTSGKSKVKAD